MGLQRAAQALEMESWQKLPLAPTMKTKHLRLHDLGICLQPLVLKMSLQTFLSPFFFFPT